MITREEAWNLLTKYNKEVFHIQHALTVEGTMYYYAKKLEYEDEAEFWSLVGLLHDLDFEMYPEEHCSKTQEIMREHDIDERLIRAVASHGYGLCAKKQPKPEHQMEKVLFAVDELTGLIGAAVKMRPSKSVMDLELSSLKKKFKDKKFAAGCSRDVMKQGAEMLGWELDKLLEETILAMRSCEEYVNKQIEEISICQSCGLPFNSKHLHFIAEETEGSRSIYCINCYKDGKFIDLNMTMEGMIETIVPALKEVISEEEARKEMTELLPKLKRWR